jgi:hypothetical protein
MVGVTGSIPVPPTIQFPGYLVFFNNGRNGPVWGAFSGCLRPFEFLGRFAGYLIRQIEPKSQVATEVFQNCAWRFLETLSSHA